MKKGLVGFGIAFAVVGGIGLIAAGVKSGWWALLIIGAIMVVIGVCSKPSTGSSRQVKKPVADSGGIGMSRVSGGKHASIRFKCSGCQRVLSTEYFQPDEMFDCRNCGAQTKVPHRSTV